MNTPAPPPRQTLRYCNTCNARERVIEHGHCIVCGCNPTARPVNATTDPPRSSWGRFVGWSRLDAYVLVLCIVTTWYLAVKVLQWLV